MAPVHFILDELSGAVPQGTAPFPTGVTYTVATPEQQLLLSLDRVYNSCPPFRHFEPDLFIPYVGPRRQLTPAEREARRLKRKAGRKSRRHNRRR